MAAENVTFDLVQDDTNPELTFTIERNGSVVPLTDVTTVKLKVFDTSTEQITNTAHQTCTIEDAPNGEVSYDLQTGDIPRPAVYLNDIVLTYNTGEIETMPGYVIFYVRPKAGTVS